MGLIYYHLDGKTRPFMVEEIQDDTANQKTYFSSYLSEVGRNDWPALLESAADQHSDDWLGNELRLMGRLNVYGQRRKPSGGYTTVRVPVTAHETLSEGEFNRFYIRGLCRRAIADGIPYLIVYRAKEVAVPRRESEAMIGEKVDSMLLLADVREHVGVQTSSGFPGPNSGISVRLPDGY